MGKIQNKKIFNFRLVISLFGTLVLFLSFQNCAKNAEVNVVPLDPEFLDASQLEESGLVLPEAVAEPSPISEENPGNGSSGGSGSSSICDPLPGDVVFEITEDAKINLKDIDLSSGRLVVSSSDANRKNVVLVGKLVRGEVAICNLNIVSIPLADCSKLRLENADLDKVYARANESGSVPLSVIESCDGIASRVIAIIPKKKN